MRDVSFKITTRRAAVARAELTANRQTIVAIREGKVPKGDPLPIAKVAAVTGAKRTTEWIPYCHPIPIEYVGVDFELLEDRIIVEVEVVSIAKTGVEMEAMTAAAAAALTLYDMLKMIDDGMEIVGVRLLSKIGGKSDHLVSEPWSAAVVTLEGQDADLSEAITDGLKGRGASTVSRLEVADEDAVVASIQDLADKLVPVIVVAVDGALVSPLIEHPLPGVVEAIRRYQQERVPTSMLVEPAAGLVGSSVVIALPGSSHMAADTLHALFPGLLHARSLLVGGVVGG
jgi:molybdenum cofactor biosynthesis protein MoaC